MRKGTIEYLYTDDDTEDGVDVSIEFTIAYDYFPGSEPHWDEYFGGDPGEGAQIYPTHFLADAVLCEGRRYPLSHAEGLALGGWLEERFESGTYVERAIMERIASVEEGEPCYSD